MNPTGDAALPLPDPDAAAHSERVRARIAEEIRAGGGAIPFSRFVSLALYEPGLGYYSAGARKLGRDGDFVTAPEISPLFSRCLARACGDILREPGGGDILEVGGGSGAMAVDLMAALAALDRLPGRYRILEVSADLRERQRARVAGLPPAMASRFEWLDAPPQTPFRGVVLGNEVVDALAFERFRMAAGGPVRLGVALDGENFAWTNLPANEPLRAAVAAIEVDLGRALPLGYESEVCLDLVPWLSGIAAPLEAGAVLLIDYGLGRREYYHPDRAAGTMMCHYRHRAHPDPFFAPGLQDITAWVDFTALADAGMAAGLDFSGLTTQAAFLLGTGVTELLADSDPAMGPEVAAAARQLLLPGEMGERVRVIGFGRQWSGTLPGLTFTDLSGSL